MNGSTTTGLAATTPGAALAGALARVLIGVHAPNGGDARVVWTETGDEVLVHWDTLRTGIHDGWLMVTVEMEADDVGRQPVPVRYRLSRDRDGRLSGTTDDDPMQALAAKGDRRDVTSPLLARWGHSLQDVIWAALVTLVDGAAKPAAPAPAGGDRPASLGHAFPEITAALAAAGRGT